VLVFKPVVDREALLPRPVGCGEVPAEEQTDAVTAQGIGMQMRIDSPDLGAVEWLSNQRLPSSA
jgi:hypothetical protein